MPTTIALKGNHNFFTESSPAFQEVPLSEFENEEYSVFSFLYYISRGKLSLCLKDRNYFVYSVEGETVRLLDVTGFIYSQMELTQLLFFWNLCFILVVYLMSLYFVKSSLKNLKKMAKYAQNLDFDDLSIPLKLKGHKYDEIKLIADAFDSSLEKINVQILALKDFIANASHELKTPLMMISSEVDIALKKKDYVERLLTIKESTKRLSDLLDTLSLITRLESMKSFETTELSLSVLTQQVKNDLLKSYPDCTVSVKISKDLQVQANERFLEIVLKNLIENACKYAGKNAKITVIADNC